ncbi:B12-binding domain-containing radical SAM protein [Archaeoglobus veneficus]|uniref:B12-binding domain-containing radical SAM protein n=1 Tax=Archaeoglobus veneficus TaxID=58290 RepID=UPI0022B2984C|nr:radical SAM protein [Archaeoglobus veneficus]
MALVYPNRYVGGIANIGLQHIYAEINSLDNYICERFYWDVFSGTKSVESGTPLKEFDIALFSLQYEEDYFKAIKIIKESEFTGLKVAGGPCVMENPLPLVELFDYFYFGEVDGDVTNLIKACEKGEETEYLVKAERIGGEKVKVRKADLSTHLQTQIVGSGAYGECYLLEVGRGCKRACSFCIVRQIYSPCRWRDVKLLLEIAEGAKKFVDKVALVAPSVTDHPKAKELIASLIDMGFLVSPSSVRADTLDEELVELLSRGGLESLTIAPEAGSERMRRLLRKGISEEDVLNAASLAAKHGIEKVKMYFMVGLPGESHEDVRAIVELVDRVKKLVPRVSVSINPLVPKPHTPLQWEPFGGIDDVKAGMKALKEKIRFLKKELGRKGASVSAESAESFAIQTILSRGNKEVGRAIAENNFRLRDFYAYLGRIEEDEDLPWDFIDHGYSKSRLLKEYERLKSLIS